MRPRVKLALTMLATLGAVAVAGLLFVLSGVYNMGADDHHNKLVLTLIETLRERSIAHRDQALSVPSLDDPAKVALGAQQYAAHCLRLAE